MFKIKLIQLFAQWLSYIEIRRNSVCYRDLVNILSFAIGFLLLVILSVMIVAEFFPSVSSHKLLPCKIWDFHGGDYEECRILGCGAVKILCEPTFRRKASLPSSG
jgi:hypothetical protein